jgi:hypothetical protein
MNEHDPLPLPIVHKDLRFTLKDIDNSKLPFPARRWFRPDQEAEDKHAPFIAVCLRNPVAKAIVHMYENWLIDTKEQALEMMVVEFDRVVAKYQDVEYEQFIRAVPSLSGSKTVVGKRVVEKRTTVIINGHTMTITEPVQ